MYYLKYKEEVGVSGEILQVVGAIGQLGQCVVLGTVKLRGCCKEASVWGIYFLCYLLIIFQIKLLLFTLFCTVDILLCLRHLAEPRYSEFYNLLARWSNVFSRNKYNVGITQEEYAI